MNRLFSYICDEVKDIGLANLTVFLAVFLLLIVEIGGSFFLTLSWKVWLVALPVVGLLFYFYREEIILFIANLTPKSLNLFVFVVLLLVFASTILPFSYYGHISSGAPSGRMRAGILLFNVVKFPIFFVWSHIYSDWRYLFWLLDVGLLALRKYNKRTAGWMLVIVQLLLISIIHRDVSTIAAFGEWMNSMFGLQAAAAS